jgi:hypothetical protein
MSRYGKGTYSSGLSIPLSGTPVLEHPAALHVKEAPLRRLLPLAPPSSFLSHSVVRPGAPVSRHAFAPAWDNMNGEQDPEEIEELFAPSTGAPPMPELHSDVPAWEFSPLEAIPGQRMIRILNNSRRGRGYRTRRGGRKKVTRRRHKRRHKA